MNNFFIISNNTSQVPAFNDFFTFHLIAIFFLNSTNSTNSTNQFNQDFIHTHTNTHTKKKKKETEIIFDVIYMLIFALCQ